ncbi:MAG: galactokinase [Actinomycetaceae bacterium]|nr:galactokinase [Actinomycetaceae bacterium]
MIIVDAWANSTGSARAISGFSAFEGDPDGVWAAPGRVNLIGEHTDYNGGLCLPIALPHATYAAARVRADRTVRLVSAQMTDPVQIDLDQVGPRGSEHQIDSWAAYVVGVAWALEQAGYGPLPGLDIAIDSCVPFGAGLSSSASLECAVAVAWAELADLKVSKRQLVDACRRAENDIAGAPTGGLDQSASLLALAGEAILLDFADFSVTPVPFDLRGADLELLVIDTKAKHSLNDGQYARRRATCEAAAKVIGVPVLAKARESDLALLRGEQLKRARHVLTEIERTRLTTQILREGPLDDSRLAEVGQLFNASHDSLRDDYEVTCPELDLAVEVARTHGAHGARMTGGGFGGSAIALVNKEDAKQVAAAIEEAYAKAGFSAPQFLVVEPGAPARRVQ